MQPSMTPLGALRPVNSTLSIVYVFFKSEIFGALFRSLSTALHMDASDGRGIGGHMIQLEFGLNFRLSFEMV